MFPISKRLGKMSAGEIFHTDVFDAFVKSFFAPVKVSRAFATHKVVLMLFLRCGGAQNFTDLRTDAQMFLCESSQPNVTLFITK